MAANSPEERYSADGIAELLTRIEQGELHIHRMGAFCIERDPIGVRISTPLLLRIIRLLKDKETSPLADT